MTDFIMAPAIIGICVYGFYKFVELLAHRKERLLMVEKISEISAASDVNIDKIFGEHSGNSRFVSMRLGAILLGVGVGLLIGFIISNSIFGTDYLDFQERGYYVIRGNIGLIYGSSTLIFGGISLLLCFFFEQKCRRGKR